MSFYLWAIVILYALLTLRKMRFGLPLLVMFRFPSRGGHWANLKFGRYTVIPCVVECRIGAAIIDLFTGPIQMRPYNIYKHGKRDMYNEGDCGTVGLGKMFLESLPDQPIT